MMTSRENLLADDDDSVEPNAVDEMPYPNLKTAFDRSALCNPFGSIHRFVVFIFICILSFGNYFCYDTPASLQSAIERDLGISNQQYGLMYSVYSWPNVILSFLGGYSIDSWLGIRWGAILFAACLALGQFVVAAGAYVNLFGLILAGRFIYALGGESLSVAQNTYTVKWFKGNELNTVFGIQLSFARIGSTITQATMLPIYSFISSNYFSGYKALGASLFIAFLTTLLSLFCAFVLRYFDKRRDRFLAVQRASHDKQQDEELDADALPVDRTPFSLRDILRFPLTMWLLCSICVTFYASVFPLVSFGQLFYVNKFKLPPYTASVCNGIIYLVAIPAAIVGGMLVDYFGRNVLFILISILLTLLGHALLAFTFLTPFVAMVIMGIAYSLLAASFWPCVAYVVPEKALGTAYGVMQSIQNLGLALVFLLVGLIVDRKGYLVLELFFISFLCLALALAILLYFVDGYHGGLLSMDGRTRKSKIKSK